MSVPRARSTRHCACKFDHPEVQHLRTALDTAEDSLARSEQRGVEANLRGKPRSEPMLPASIQSDSTLVVLDLAHQPVPTTYDLARSPMSPNWALEDERPRILATEFPIHKE